MNVSRQKNLLLGGVMPLVKNDVRYVRPSYNGEVISALAVVLELEPDQELKNTKQNLVRKLNYK